MTELASSWRRIISRMSFPPNMEVEVYSLSFQNVMHISIYAPDTYKANDPSPESSEVQKITHRFPMPDRPWDERGMVDFIRNYVHRAVRHETDEWLRLDGEIISNPHERSGR